MLDLNEDFLRGAAVGVAAAGAAMFVVSKLSATAIEEVELSTTSNSHDGNVYETDKAVAEYLHFHFGTDEEMLPYEDAPKSALQFASRNVYQGYDYSTAAICVDWCKKLNVPLTRAFDIGCAVGRTSFDLSKDFDSVVGVDFSHSFINTANKIKAGESITYSASLEADLRVECVAHTPAGSNPDRIIFQQGDVQYRCSACNIAKDIGKFSVIHGANLLCRLPEPTQFLDRLPSLLVSGGIVVLISPYSWLKSYTAKDKWIGGFVDGTGKACKSADKLTAYMAGLGFKLVHQEETPFLIREHIRKFQWGCSHTTVWQLSK